MVKSYLEEFHIQVLPHTPYNPDLSPCDFWYNPYIKSCRRGRKFETRSAVGTALYQCINSILKEQFKNAFSEWISRLEKCVQVNGDVSRIFKARSCCHYLKNAPRTSLEEERASLGAFCTFVQLSLVWFCLFPLSLGVWEGLRFVLVALPGLFSYPSFLRKPMTINREKLWQRLSEIGVSGKLFKTIKSLYSSVTSCVMVNNMHTGWFDVKCGLRQGCILSSVLFNLYINDLVLYLKSFGKSVKCNDDYECILLYADGVVLLTSFVGGIESLVFV